MGLFSKKKEWDIPRSDANKAKMRALFNSVVSDGDSYKLAYGYSQTVKLKKNLVISQSVTTITSLIVGYRTSDMSIVLVQTTPELEQCAEPDVFKKGEIKKAKGGSGAYTIYHQGGIMAGATQVEVVEEYDEDWVAYVYQRDEAIDFENFWKAFSSK